VLLQDLPLCWVKRRSRWLLPHTIQKRPLRPRRLGVADEDAAVGDRGRWAVVAGVDTEIVLRQHIQLGPRLDNITDPGRDEVDAVADRGDRTGQVVSYSTCSYYSNSPGQIASVLLHAAIQSVKEQSGGKQDEQKLVEAIARRLVASGVADQRK
jgi:hypothetical protein